MSEGDPRDKSEWKWFRMETIIRDDYTCQNCGVRGGRKGEAQMEVHHKTPVEDGGETELGNLTTFCVTCHRQHHRKQGMENRREQLRKVLSDRIGIDEDLECPKMTVPVSVASRGQKAIAAYMFAHQEFSIERLASRMDKSTQTIRQYLSDYKAGRTG